MKPTVFLSGGALLCIEIVGAQLVTPYFGSSVYVWGSVMSVFLGALGLGYFAGGRFALYRAYYRIPPMLIFISGVWVLLAGPLSSFLCNRLLALEILSPFTPLLPLGAVAILFFVPVSVLGMVLPLAVQVSTASRQTAGPGGIVGVLYALNAAGSMLGALGVTFVMAVFFGNHAILMGCGFLLLLTAALLAIFSGHTPKIDVRKREESSLAKKGQWDLKAFVFVCGIVVMGLEAVGGAHIAPYFGSTVFVWGSLITIFLCALTAGYRIGGGLAERYASVGLLYATVCVGGFFLLFVPFVVPAICSYGQSLSSGGLLDLVLPLPVAFVLYFVPVTCFAIATPVAVRLGADRPDMTGNVAGRFYGISTAGNVVGLLSATFILIPASGATNLVTASGAVAVLSGLIFAHRYRARLAMTGAWSPALACLLLCIVAGAVLAPKPDPVPLAAAHEKSVGTMGGWNVVRLKEHPDYAVMRRVRYETESPYHHIAVIDEKKVPTGTPIRLDDDTFFEASFTTVYGNRRGLRFDRYIQSSVVLDDRTDTIRLPYESGLSYTDVLHVPMLINPAIHRVLVIGGGGGVFPVVFKHAYPVVIDVVEIDPVVVSVAVGWFGLVTGEGMGLHTEDGRMFIRRAQGRYDYIVLDAYTAGGRVPFHLTTCEFMEEVRSHLTPKGIAFMNIIGSLRGPKSRPFRSIVKTVRSVFGVDSVFILPIHRSGNEKATDLINIIVGAMGTGYSRRPAKADLLELLAHLASSGNEVAERAFKQVEHMLNDEDLSAVEQDDVPVLTDDYAPLDLMAITLSKD